MASPAAARPRVVAGLRLLEQVGEGGEGEVWEARDATGRRRALKLIRPDALVPPAEVERRGRWLLDIDHPALVAVHRCGLLSGAGLDGWGFVEMDFVDGTPLSLAPADPDALVRLEPLAEALDLLHAGIWSDGTPLVHRDVKPANLIEDDDGDLVLVDNSTLRDVDDGTRTRIGTPLFAAPEVVTGRAGPLADVFSFAATAVALLTGARGRDLAALLADPDGVDVPDGIAAALAVDPVDRPVSCRAALDPRLPLIVGHEVGWTQVPPAPDLVDPGARLVNRTVPGRSRRPGAGGGGRSDDGRAEVWLPSATEVLLAPWDDPYGRGAHPVAGGRRGPPWPWALVLLLLGVVAAAVPLLGLPQIGPVLGVVAVGHVAACLAARQGLALTLFLPPLAWASLLAERVADPGPARAWARTSLLACASALLGLVGILVVVPAEVDALSVGALAGAAAAALLACVRAGERGRPLRVALSPVWVAGALLLLAGGLLLLVPAALVGRARPIGTVLRETAGGVAAFVRA